LMALRSVSAVRPPVPCRTPAAPKFGVIACKADAKAARRTHLWTAGDSISLHAVAVLPFFSLFEAPNEARAQVLPKEQIVTSLTQLDSALDQIQALLSSFLDTAGQVIETVKPSFEAALPVLKRAGEETAKIASPLVSEASKKAQEAIQSSGIDTQPLVTAVKTIADTAQQSTKIIDDAKPIATTTVETISSLQPIIILVSGGALVAAYLLVPSIFSVIAYSLRGYQGDLSPAQALDLLCTKNYVMIDIRSEKDKDKAGIPRLPSGAISKVVSIPLEELPSKLRSLVRSVKKVEAELVALKISHLKKISKGSNVIILDSYSDSAKIVAKTLTKLGFKNSWIVSDGFSGSKGWVQSRLGTDSYNVSTFAEVI
ncbi:extracellular calcium sensing receptor, partial [Genlisea aurea]